MVQLKLMNKTKRERFNTLAYGLADNVSCPPKDQSPFCMHLAGASETDLPAQ